MTLLAPTLEAFFTDRLIRQRNASPRTIAASISCFRSSSTLLLVSFLSGSDSPLAATVWIFTLKTMDSC